jgi:hypothetical protein
LGEKEIPISQEKNTKAARLREARQRLQDLPLERRPTDAEWDEITGELTADDLEHLKKLAIGYRDRALEGPESTSLEERIEEASSALLLWPRDPAWAQATIEAYRKALWKGPEAVAFLSALSRRQGTRAKGTRPQWLVPLVWLLVAAPVGVGVVFLWTGLDKGSGISPVQGPRNLQAVFDTQGVKANIEVAQSRMILFPDATVAELSAWVTFPDHRVDLWEGTVTVLDAQGGPLAQRDVTFRSSADGPIEPGQGVEIFQQFNAHPFYDKVSGFQVSTRRILAREAHPKDRRGMEVGGLDALTTGYNLKVWIQDQQWTDRFASKVHTLNLELENTGLKPFAELQFLLVWRDNHGKTLKTLVLRPVSAFRTALPSGGRLPWSQETVFDTEVFSWPAGQEPHPSLELKQWQ